MKNFVALFGKLWCAKACLITAFGSGALAPSVLATTIKLTLVSEQIVNSGGVEANTSPSIARLPNGNFIVSWEDGAPTNCWARPYSPDAVPLGGQFSLDPNTPAAWKYGPVIEPLPNGGIFSVWGYSYVPMLAQLFNSSFAPSGGTLNLDLSGYGDEGYGWPASALLPNGNIVVVGADANTSNAVTAAIYNPSSNSFGPVFQVNTASPGVALSVAMTASHAGAFTPAWWNSAGNIIVRTFNQNGTPTTAELVVNSSTGGQRSNPSLAYDNQNQLWVAWVGTISGGDDIYLRSFASNGGALGSEMVVNQNALSALGLPQLAVGDDGTVAVSWGGQDSSGEGVFARIFNNDGSPATAQFPVNQYQSGDQYPNWAGGRRGATVINGNYIFAWRGTGAQGNGVYLTTFSALASPVLTSPASGATSVPITAALNWQAATGATSYDVYFGTSPNPPLITNITSTSYTPANLTPGVTYYWQVAARNTNGTNASDVWSFTTYSTPLSVVSFSVLFGSESYNLIGSSRNRLPWELTGIRIVFSEPVTAGNINSLSGMTPTSFSGLGTNTITWGISPLSLGTATVLLAGGGVNALTDAGGNTLGNGSGFAEALKVLWGDFNDDGSVTAADMVGLNNATSGPYNVLADINGDGVVNLADVAAVRSRLGTSLP